MTQKMLSALVTIGIAVAFVAVAMAGFSIGLRAGQSSKTHEYRLMLGQQETEILFETLDEIASMRVKDGSK